MRKKFLCLIVGLQLASVSVAIVIVIFGKKTCMTAKCKVITDMIRSRLNEEVDPCEDFYSFSCGDKMGIGMKSAVDEHRMTEMVNILKGAPRKDDLKIFKQLKQFYKQCTSGESKSRKVVHLRSLFHQLGGFPVLEGESWQAQNWSWLEITRKARKLGFWTNCFFKLYLIKSPSNSFKMVFSVTLPKSPGDKMSFQKLRSILELFRAIPNEKFAQEQEMIDIDILIKYLSTAHPITSLADFNRTYMTLAKLKADFDFIDWAELIRIATQSEKIPPNDMEIIIESPDYLIAMSKLFKGVSKRILANYMMWSYLSQLYPYFGESNLDLMDCYTFLEQTMPVALQSMYLNKHHEDSYEETVLDMISKIKKQFINSVANSDWIDNKTKQEALNKVKVTEARIGYPKEFLNHTFVNDLYKTLSLNGDFLISIMNLNLDLLDKVYGSGMLQERRFSDVLFLTNMLVYYANAFYLYPDNSINVLHGILRPPFFDREWPRCVNYGRLGIVIGHEFTHGLDSRGSWYDSLGRIRSWWQNNTRAEFDKKVNCFVEKFNNFSFFGNHLPGRLELEENIADSGGVKLSFLAYKSFPSSLFHPAVGLHGLDYTPDQIFFISFAQFYCRKYLPEEITLVMVDPHAPGYIRVFESLQNNQYFSETFSCGSSTNMNKKTKCELW